MSVEYYKKVIIDTIQGVTVPLGIKDIMDYIGAPESDLETIWKVIRQLLAEGKIKFVYIG